MFYMGNKVQWTPYFRTIKAAVAKQTLDCRQPAAAATNTTERKKTAKAVFFLSHWPDSNRRGKPKQRVPAQSSIKPQQRFVIIFVYDALLTRLLYIYVLLKLNVPFIRTLFVHNITIIRFQRLTANMTII